MYLNELPLFKKEVSCAFTGHRTLGKNFDEEKLFSLLKKTVKDGYEYFLVGMAVGFDTKCFQALEKLREEEKHIKLVAVMPCIDQDFYFSENQKEEYAKMVSNADYKVILYEKYKSGCMHKRNDFLVENSSLLIAYYENTGTGGTFYTINKAKKAGEEIIYL